MSKPKSIRIGIVGPEDSLNVIKQVPYSNPEAEWTFLEYDDVHNAAELVARYMNEMDVFLLTGEVPYRIVTESETEISKPLLYIPHTGTALYRTLFEMAFHHRRQMEKISIDTISEEEVAEVFRELNIPCDNNFVMPQEIQPGLWGERHLQLWKEKKIDAVITSLSTTMKYLIKHQVPVFRIRPTESVIRAYMDHAFRAGLLQDAKKGQILIQLIQIDNFNHLIHYTGSEYSTQQIQLELHKRLLDYTVEIEGAFTSLGRDAFLLVTTQGAFQKYTEGKLVNPIPEWVVEKLPITISVGIGEGQTGIEAETHARIALKHAQDHGGGCCFFTTTYGEVKGPLDDEKMVAFKYQIDGEIHRIAQKAGMSPVTLGKVAHVLEKLGKTEVTSVELSQHLKITPRQARRILTQLKTAGAAEQIGEEGHSIIGRPRSIYRIVFSGV